MIRPLAALLALAVLAACGADGPPERPEPRTGVTVTGSVGVALSAQR